MHRFYVNMIRFKQQIVRKMLKIIFEYRKGYQRCSAMGHLLCFAHRILLFSIKSLNETDVSNIPYFFIIIKCLYLIINKSMQYSVTTNFHQKSSNSIFHTQKHSKIILLSLSIFTILYPFQYSNYFLQFSILIWLQTATNPPWMKKEENVAPQSSNLLKAQRMADVERQKKELQEKQRQLEEEEKERKRQQKLKRQKQEQENNIQRELKAMEMQDQLSAKRQYLSTEKVFKDAVRWGTCFASLIESSFFQQNHYNKTFFKTIYDRLFLTYQTKSRQSFTISQSNLKNRCWEYFVASLMAFIHSRMMRLLICLLWRNQNGTSSSIMVNMPLPLYFMRRITNKDHSSHLQDHVDSPILSIQGVQNWRIIVDCGILRKITYRAESSKKFCIETVRLRHDDGEGFVSLEVGVVVCQIVDGSEGCPPNISIVGLALDAVQRSQD